MIRNTINLANDGPQGLRRTDKRTVAADALQTVALKLQEYPGAYGGLTLFAKFRHGESTYTVPFEGSECVVPWEVLKPPAFSVAVFGEATDGGAAVERLTTENLVVRVAASIDGEGVEPQEPTPGIFEQFLATAERIEDDIEAGLIQGPKGDKGDTGEQGPQGAQGPQGEQGPQGVQGEQGPKGEDGKSINILGSYDTLEDLQREHPTGNPGDGYIVGADLYVWADGWTDVGRVQGPEGPQGPQGIQGPQGEQGPQGIQGVQGDQGEQGIQGIQGPQGETGPQGEQGIQGVQGEQGPKGDPGTGITIKGSYSTLADLEREHPTGEEGDAYIVAGDLYIWDVENTKWSNVGQIQGPAGADGTSITGFVTASNGVLTQTLTDANGTTTASVDVAAYINTAIGLVSNGTY